MSLLLIISVVTIIVSVGIELLVKNLLVQPISVIGSFFVLDYVKNPDIAFSMHLPGFTEPLLIGAALILFCVLAWNSKKTTLTSIGFGLILGGAIANVIDRLGDGFVTDYIRIGTFPVFNLPDSAITAGVCLLLLEELVKIRTNK